MGKLFVMVITFGTTDAVAEVAGLHADAPLFIEKVKVGLVVPKSNERSGNPYGREEADAVKIFLGDCDHVFT